MCGGEVRHPKALKERTCVYVYDEEDSGWPSLR